MLKLEETGKQIARLTISDALRKRPLQDLLHLLRRQPVVFFDTRWVSRSDAIVAMDKWNEFRDPDADFFCFFSAFLKWCFFLASSMDPKKTTNKQEKTCFGIPPKRHCLSVSTDSPSSVEVSLEEVLEFASHMSKQIAGCAGWFFFFFFFFFFLGGWFVVCWLLGRMLVRCWIFLCVWREMAKKNGGNSKIYSGNKGTRAKNLEVAADQKNELAQRIQQKTEKTVKNIKMFKTKPWVCRFPLSCPSAFDSSSRGVPSEEKTWSRS